MAIEVRATRMEMLQLKKRFKLAKKGHKLLKDKLDELMRRFLRMIRGYKALHQEVEEMLLKAHNHFLFARAMMTPIDLHEAFV